MILFAVMRSAMMRLRAASMSSSSSAADVAADSDATAAEVICARRSESSFRSILRKVALVVKNGVCFA